MFFNNERLHFFKPLTSKYREQIVQSLSLLYERQFGAAADYGHALNRDQTIELLEEALARSSKLVLEEDYPDAAPEQRFKSHREQASWVLKQLIDCGWIERQVDSATMQSTFPFTRMGRLFSHALIESASKQIRTRHRNTRNTLNALEAFASRGEIYDLLDAYEYSERIITDFTDVIAELEERKRELVKEVEAQQLVQQATEQFFDFMEKRFQPDIAVRLSADSVEKHREDISRTITGIRRKPKDFKQSAERQLRVTVPDLCVTEQSYLWFILDSIDQRMRNAADVMLPALRRALHSFTKRADIIIRQLSYLTSQQDSNLVEVCRELSDLSDDQYQARIEKAADVMATMQMGWVDPQHIRMQERRIKADVDSAIVELGEVDDIAKREQMVQQLLDQAFILNNSGVKDYVSEALKSGQSISTRDLPIRGARDLLAMAHVIEVGAVNSLSTELKFQLNYTGRQVEDNDYYKSFDEFTIELVSTESE
ncbi:Uncharacterised protein [BD1-7 clade bacterium]|uniref:Flagellar protein FliT n=1 Tax=BD1-7 clade bacterium TaxID=2029982 RepID=A0A5S9PDT9_9GAMM|nr:Uncharacterised protein [BD1-7 clade bacterium]